MWCSDQHLLLILLIYTSTTLFFSKLTLLCFIYTYLSLACLYQFTNNCIIRLLKAIRCSINSPPYSFDSTMFELDRFQIIIERDHVIKQLRFAKFNIIIEPGELQEDLNSLRFVWCRQAVMLFAVENTLSTAVEEMGADWIASVI